MNVYLFMAVIFFSGFFFGAGLQITLTKLMYQKYGKMPKWLKDMGLQPPSDKITTNK